METLRGRSGSIGSRTSAATRMGTESEDAEAAHSAGAMLGVLDDVSELAEVGARRWRYLASRTVPLFIAVALAYTLFSGVLRWAALACCVFAAVRVARGFFLRRRLQEKYSTQSPLTASVKVTG